MRMGTMELVVVLLVVLVIFGPKQLPKLAKMFGKTAKSFKEGMDDMDDTEAPAKKEADTVEKTASAAAEEKTEDKAE